MKRLFILFAVCFTLFMSTPASAQINININIQPSWGPSGYDYAEYYYIPELNIYYDVANALFYYLSGNVWTGARYLPTKYKKYDLSSMYKVVMNDVSKPWLNNKEHKKTYKNYVNDRTQIPIRQTADAKHEPARANTQPWVDNKPATTTSKKASSASKPSASSSKSTSKTTSSASKPSSSTKSAEPAKPANNSAKTTSKPSSSTSKPSSSSSKKTGSSSSNKKNTKSGKK
ncbi:MAG: hypothetical protein LUC22_00500 [Prevotella sp.]|nr:hypothetical protein [Prevotella sp.]